MAALSASAGVAFYAVLVVINPFFLVFFGHSGFTVFMAVVAGIFFVIGWIGMAGFTACLVVAVQPEILTVIKGRRFPGSCAMACGAACLGEAVQLVIWLVTLMAAYALLSAKSCKLLMVESCRFPSVGGVALQATARC